MSIKSVCVSVIAFALFISSNAFAGNVLPSPVLQFAGYFNNQPVYKLEIKNPEKMRLTVTIRDTEGTVLHEEVVEGENITRKYCFLREELGYQDLIVEVTRSEKEAIFSTIRLERKKMNR